MNICPTCAEELRSSYLSHNAVTSELEQWGGEATETERSNLHEWYVTGLLSTNTGEL